jgi:hypothetical protein
MFLRLVDIGWQTCTFLAIFVGMPLLIVYSTIDVRFPTPPFRVQRCESCESNCRDGIAHAAVSRRPPISLSRMVARAEDCTHAATAWAMSLVHAPFSVAPCPSPSGPIHNISPHIQLGFILDTQRGSGRHDMIVGSREVHRVASRGNATSMPGFPLASGLTGLAGVTKRPAGYPSGGVPPAAES